MPKVSIITPVYNAEKYLAATLDSVLSQTFHDFEIVCVNDGSTDKSRHILEEYEQRDKRVRVIDQENNGGSAARNRGIAEAIGEYVMFIDADDLYAKTIVEHAYDLALSTDVDVVFYNFARFSGHKPTKLAVRSRTKPAEDPGIVTKDTYSQRFFNDFGIITWNKLVKKSVLDSSKLTFNIGLSHNHDVDFSIRLMLAADTYAWLDEVGYYYRSNDTGLTATKRSDPTNVLKILTELNTLIAPKYKQVKQSFDNYVVDMIAGTLEKYSGDKTKQKTVFDFARDTLIPKLGLHEKDDSYFTTGRYRVYELVKADDYRGYVAYSGALTRKLRIYLRKTYDTAQRVLARITV